MGQRMLKPLRTQSRTQYDPFAVSVLGRNRSQLSKVSEDPEVEGQPQWPTVSRTKMLCFLFQQVWLEEGFCPPKRKTPALCVSWPCAVYWKLVPCTLVSGHLCQEDICWGWRGPRRLHAIVLLFPTRWYSFSTAIFLHILSFSTWLLHEYPP